MSDGTKRQKSLPFSSSEGSVLIFILLRRVRHVRVFSAARRASFRQYFLRPFAGRDRVVGIDACVRPAAGVDTDPFSCAQWDAFAGEQEAGILHDALQLPEHFTGDEILVHGRDGIGLEAMVLRRGRMSGQHGSRDDG